MSGEYNRDGSSRDGFISIGNGVESSDAPTSPVAATSAVPPAVPADTDPTLDAQGRAVDDLLSSDIGINTLLARLKQSIASARDFAAFLKKRSSLEEEQATGLKRLSKAQFDTLRRSEVKAGSYAAQLAELMRCHERIADNGMQFALSLHQMHEDLHELSNSMERGRKQWKHEGLDVEKRASDAEAAMQKAKARYDSLAEDYDRARTGDTKGTRRIGLKGPKSAEQHESDLLRKVQAADADYEEKVKLAKAQRESLLRDGRPKAVKALRELCHECDSGLALQLQKFATFNEKLLLGNGLAVSPLTDKEVPSGQKSLRETVAGIDNERDFNNFITSHRLPPRPSEIRYEQHPTLVPRSQPPPSSFQPAQTAPPSQMNMPGATSQPASMNGRFAAQQPGAPMMGSPQSPSYNSPSSNAPPQIPSTLPPYAQQLNLPFHTQQSTSSGPAPPSGGEHDAFAAPPYPTHPSERVGYPSQTSGSIPGAAAAGAAGATGLSSLPSARNFNGPPGAGPGNNAMNTSPSAPLKPVFGVSLEDLFARDASAVPMVVIQCILAVDTFGLDVEGIYRVSGTTSHVNKLRDQFNRNAAAVDLRNPAVFFHDVNSVAQVLKQFFRDLPDPLFSRSAYGEFISAARIDDDTARRDGLHQLINDLPDPNYATLRALVLHLHRVMQHESRNRMGSGNLALCFAPSLMGQHTGPQIADASLQARVVDTILQNATAIFDED